MAEGQGELVAEQGQYEGGAARVESRPVAPTLFIGLGGTGLKVLARFRQRIEDLDGDPDYWEHYAFLGIDTNINDLNMGGVVDGKGSAINPNDRLSIGMSDNQVRMVLQELHGTHTHLGWWLSDDAANLTGQDFTTGAGQIRAAGRLLFIEKIRAVREKIEKRLEGVRSHAALAAARRKGADLGAAVQKTDVVIIGSIGGGTGAGSFLDCAYLLRHLQMEGLHDVGEIRGILLTPDVFMGRLKTDQERETVKANGYAALRELEYYSPKAKELIRPFHVSSWGVEWATEPIREFPFNTCYLMSLNNGTEGTSDDDMYDMVADALAFSLGGTQMAGAMRGCWSNAQASVYRGQMSYQLKARHADGGPDRDPPEGQPLPKNHLRFERKWSTRFSSLGIASVTMKLSELRRLAAVRAVRRLINFELGAAPEARDELAGREVEQAAQRINGVREFVKPETRQILMGQADAASRADKAAAAESAATNLLSGLYGIAQRLEVDKARPGEAESVLKLRKEAERLAREYTTDLLATLKDMSLGRAKWKVAEVTARVRKEKDAVAAKPMGPFAAELLGVDQWKDYDADDDGYWFGLGAKADAIIRERFRGSAGGRVAHFLSVINTNTRRLYLAEVLRILDAKDRELQDAITFLDRWRAQELDGVQDRLAQNFESAHNVVLTADLAPTCGARDKEAKLDREIDRALAKSLALDGPDDDVLMLELRGAVMKELARRWKLDGKLTPTTMLQARRTDVESHGDATDVLLKFLSKELLKELPRVQDVFQALSDEGRNLAEILKTVAERSAAYWRFADEKYQVTAHTTSMACAVIPDQGQRDRIRERVQEFFAGTKIDFKPAYLTTPGAPVGDIVIVHEVHGFSIPSFWALGELRGSYQLVASQGRMDDRHLDKRLGAHLPEIDPVQFRDASDGIEAWDDALLGIVLGIFRWDEGVRQYRYHGGNSKKPPAVGDTYPVVARWLIEQVAANGFNPVRELIQKYLGDLSGAAYAARGREAAHAAARNGAAAIVRLQLVLDRLGDQCFVTERRDNKEYFPPDHTMTRRLRLRLEERLSVLRGTGDRWEAVDVGQIKDAVAAELHRHVSFVGPRAAMERLGSDLERQLARKRRVLQLTEPPRAEGDRSVLTEAFELQWFKEEFKFHDPIELRSLFPDWPAVNPPMPAGGLGMTSVPVESPPRAAAASSSSSSAAAGSEPAAEAVDGNGTAAAGDGAAPGPGPAGWTI